MRDWAPDRNDTTSPLGVDSLLFFSRSQIGPFDVIRQFNLSGERLLRFAQPSLLAICFHFGVAHAQFP